MSARGKKAGSVGALMKYLQPSSNFKPPDELSPNKPSQKQKPSRPSSIKTQSPDVSRPTGAGVPLTPVVEKSMRTPRVRNNFAHRLQITTEDTHSSTTVHSPASVRSSSASSRATRQKIPPSHQAVAADQAGPVMPETGVRTALLVASPLLLPKSTSGEGSANADASSSASAPALSCHPFISLDVITAVDKCLPHRHIQIQSYASMTADEVTKLKELLSGDKILHSVEFHVVVATAKATADEVDRSYFWDWNHVVEFLAVLLQHKLIDRETHVTMPNSDRLHSALLATAAADTSMTWIFPAASDLNPEQQSTPFTLIPSVGKTADALKLMSRQVYYGSVRNIYGSESATQQPPHGYHTSLFFPRALFAFRVVKEVVDDSEGDMRVFSKDRADYYFQLFHSAFATSHLLHPAPAIECNLSALLVEMPAFLKAYIKKSDFPQLVDSSSYRGRGLTLDPYMFREEASRDLSFAVRTTYFIPKDTIIGYHGGFVRARTEDDIETNLVAILSDKEVLDAAPLFDSLFNVIPDGTAAERLAQSSMFDRSWGIKDGVNGITAKERQELLQYGGWLFLAKFPCTENPNDINCIFENGEITVVEDGSNDVTSLGAVRVLRATKDIKAGDILVAAGEFKQEMRFLDKSNVNSDSSDSERPVHGGVVRRGILKIGEKNDSGAAAAAADPAAAAAAVPSQIRVDLSATSTGSDKDEPMNDRQKEFSAAPEIREPESAAAMDTSTDKPDEEKVVEPEAVMDANSPPPHSDAQQTAHVNAAATSETAAAANSGQGDSGKESDEKSAADESSGKDGGGGGGGSGEKEKQDASEVLSKDKAGELNYKDALSLVKFYNTVVDQMVKIVARPENPSRLDDDAKLGCLPRNNAIFFVIDPYIEGDKELGYPLIPVRMKLVPADGLCNVMSTLLACDNSDEDLLSSNRPRTAGGGHLKVSKLAELRKDDAQHIEQLRDKWSDLGKKIQTLWKENSPLEKEEPYIQYLSDRIKRHAEDLSLETAEHLLDDFLTALKDQLWVGELSLLFSAHLFKSNIRYLFSLQESDRPVEASFPFIRSESWTPSRDTLNGLLIPNTPNMSMFYPSKEAEDKSWNWSSGGQSRALLVRTEIHYDYALAAPDLMPLFNSPFMPVRWMPSVLWPLSDHFANNNFLAPYFSMKRRNCVRLTLRPFDVINFTVTVDGTKIQRVGVVLAIVLKWAPTISTIKEHIQKNMTKKINEKERFHLGAKFSVNDANFVSKMLLNGHSPRFELAVLPLELVPFAIMYDKEKSLEKKEEDYVKSLPHQTRSASAAGFPAFVENNLDKFQDVLLIIARHDIIDNIHGSKLSDLFQETEEFNDEVAGNWDVKERLDKSAIGQVLPILVAQYFQESIQHDIAHPENSIAMHARQLLLDCGASSRFDANTKQASSLDFLTNTKQMATSYKVQIEDTSLDHANSMFNKYGTHVLHNLLSRYSYPVDAVVKIWKYSLPLNLAAGHTANGGKRTPFFRPRFMNTGYDVTKVYYRDVTTWIHSGDPNLTVLERYELLQLYEIPLPDSLQPPAEGASKKDTEAFNTVVNDLYTSNFGQSLDSRYPHTEHWIRKILEDKKIQDWGSLKAAERYEGLTDAQRDSFRRMFKALNAKLPIDIPAVEDEGLLQRKKEASRTTRSVPPITDDNTAAAAAADAAIRVLNRVNSKGSAGKKLPLVPLFEDKPLHQIRTSDVVLTAAKIKQALKASKDLKKATKRQRHTQALGAGSGGKRKKHPSSDTGTAAKKSKGKDGAAQSADEEAVDLTAADEVSESGGSDDNNDDDEKEVADEEEEVAEDESDEKESGDSEPNVGVLLTWPDVKSTKAHQKHLAQHYRKLMEPPRLVDPKHNVDKKKKGTPYCVIQGLSKSGGILEMAVYYAGLVLTAGTKADEDRTSHNAAVKFITEEILPRYDPDLYEFFNTRHPTSHQLWHPEDFVIVFNAVKEPTAWRDHQDAKDMLAELKQYDKSFKWRPAKINLFDGESMLPPALVTQLRKTGSARRKSKSATTSEGEEGNEESDSQSETKSVVVVEQAPKTPPGKSTTAKKALAVKSAQKKAPATSSSTPPDSHKLKKVQPPKPETERERRARLRAEQEATMAVEEATQIESDDKPPNPAVHKKKQPESLTAARAAKSRTQTQEGNEEDADMADSDSGSTSEQVLDESDPSEKPPLGIRDIGSASSHKTPNKQAARIKALEQQVAELKAAVGKGSNDQSRGPQSQESSDSKLDLLLSTMEKLHKDLSTSSSSRSAADVSPAKSLKEQEDERLLKGASSLFDKPLDLNKVPSLLKDQVVQSLRLMSGSAASPPPQAVSSGDSYTDYLNSLIPSVMGLVDHAIRQAPPATPARIFHTHPARTLQYESYGTRSPPYGSYLYAPTPAHVVNYAPPPDGYGMHFPLPRHPGPGPRHPTYYG